MSARRAAAVCLGLLLAAGCGAKPLSESEQWWLAPPAAATHVAFVRDGKWGYRDRAGRVIVEPQFEYAVSFPGSGDVMAVSSGQTVHYRVEAAPLGRVKAGGKWGYVDSAGNFVIAPRFDEACDFFEELTAVRLGVLWGYIDRRGELVLPPAYDAASPFLLGVAHVRRGGEWFVIDKTGKRAGDEKTKTMGGNGNGD